jgi:hypothetical protein
LRTQTDQFGIAGARELVHALGELVANLVKLGEVIG